MGSICWNCGRSTTGRFCLECKALQPPQADYFEFFGIPRQLAVDSKDLEKRFYTLSRQLHPDLFSRKGSREREYSLESTAALNDAYRTLRDPVARAHYVLKSEGFDVGQQGTKEVPPELLDEVFELNMAMEELRGGDGGGEDDARDQIAAAKTRFEAMLEAVDTEVSAEFQKWDASHDRGVLTKIRGLLNRRKYITNLIAQTESA